MLEHPSDAQGVVVVLWTCAALAQTPGMGADQYSIVRPGFTQDPRDRHPHPDTGQAAAGAIPPRTPDVHSAGQPGPREDQESAHPLLC